MITFFLLVHFFLSSSVSEPECSFSFFFFLLHFLSVSLPECSESEESESLFFFLHFLGAHFDNELSCFSSNSLALSAMLKSYEDIIVVAFEGDGDTEDGSALI